MRGAVGQRPTPYKGLSKTASSRQLVEHNMAFYQTLKTAEETKTAEMMGSMLKAQIYESSTCEQFHPPADMRWEDLDKDENPDNVFKIRDKEYTSPAAVQLSFRGQAFFERVETQRFRVNATMISSPEFYLKEQEVRLYDQPIEDVLRTQIAFHMRKQIDALWYGALEEALAANNNDQVIDLTGTGIYMITAEVIVRAINPARWARRQRRQVPARPHAGHGQEPVQQHLLLAPVQRHRRRGLAARHAAQRGRLVDREGLYG